MLMVAGSKMHLLSTLVVIGLDRTPADPRRLSRLSPVLVTDAAVASLGGLIAWQLHPTWFHTTPRMRSKLGSVP